MKNPLLKKQNSDLTDSKSRIFIWTLFDFANTSYSIVVVTFIFAVYFKQHILQGESIGDFYWSIGTSVSMLITAIISPILGAVADHSAGKKRFLLGFTLLCIVSTSLLYYVGVGDVFWALLLFITANIGFEAGLVFYDSFLPEITKPKNYGRVSGYGFAMGYIGSFVALALSLPFIKNEMIKETFPLAALFFLVFSLPVFLFLKEKRKVTSEKISFFEIGFSRVAYTIKNLKNYKNLGLFLLAFFFYIEGVNTVIYFSGNYASTTLNFSMEDLIYFFIIVQTTAVIGSVSFGLLSDSIGQKKSISISLVVWIITIVFAYQTSSTDTYITKTLATWFDTTPESMIKICFYLVGLIVGSVMGATQSTSRSLMSKLTPPEKKTEFFGFYSFFGKSSAILGPLVFGLVSYAFDSQRLAILTICIFFIVGLVILHFVQEPELAEEN
ncbi:MAG: MFS transporter [Bacteroidetes bacterium]|nr:MFS transporter [Bacteroidota bacterium]